MTTLRWELLDGREGDEAFSGDLRVGSVVHRTAEPRVWVYSLDAVHTKWIAEGYGEVASRDAAKRAVERAWSTWCEKAGLAAIPI